MEGSTIQLDRYFDKTTIRMFKIKNLTSPETKLK